MAFKGPWLKMNISTQECVSASTPQFRLTGIDIEPQQPHIRAQVDHHRGAGGRAEQQFSLRL
jgi:hypothetical protein